MDCFDTFFNYYYKFIIQHLDSFVFLRRTVESLSTRTLVRGEACGWLIEGGGDAARVALVDYYR